MADPLVGRVLADKYKIESLIGRGGMGAVYRARQSALQRSVAVKVLDPIRSADAKFALRFKREAKFASKFEHPNSMRVVDFGQEPDGLLYLVMELLDGRNLLRVMHEDWPLSDARIADFLAQTLAALAVAHTQGVLHRDLKPENIMILKGTDDEERPIEIVKVCDFGIAKVLERDANDGDGESSTTQTGTLTAQGVVVGTPEYISPEQVLGEKVDARSDIYATGVMLYQLLTGSLPFRAADVTELVRLHVEEAPKRPREIFPDVNPRLEAVCAKAMSKVPADRYQSAREMRTDLRAAVGAVPEPRAPETPPADAAPPKVARPPLAPVRRGVRPNPSSMNLPWIGGPGSASVTSLPSIATSPSEVTTKTVRGDEAAPATTAPAPLSRAKVVLVAAIAFLAAILAAALFRAR